MSDEEEIRSQLFHALSNEVRRKILLQISKGPACVNDLAANTGRKPGTVRRHLSILHEAGLATSTKDGPVRNWSYVPEATQSVLKWCQSLKSVATPDAATPNYVEFLDLFEKSFRNLCIDYAFVVEYLSRHELLAKADRSLAQQALDNAFWTYRDSLYLGVAKLLDGVRNSLSLKSFISGNIAAERWSLSEFSEAFCEWKQDFNVWTKGEGMTTVLLYRDENIAHSLEKGAGEKRRWSKSSYKNFTQNSMGEYLGTNQEHLEACKEGILLLARLMTLCERGRNQPSYFGFKRAAERDFDKEVSDCRRGHAALIDLL
ncbi:ArsR/SmtB family transcription factor [Roseibium litorale]|uniref:Winged helix-turn-helix transcriptional regulator n=1 Tax=Roseibium litorale TaxID=2803841 RepID=A0ABR9CRT3_9HYPH|nr:metalloregulator ArsR/SmtB family transcription factor [Roseibium litorale]MBD8893542.1 winged helix-turn-helix transcriptional regulator [Roseibium litorale]